MGDVLFDNVFSDFAQHDRIKESQSQMQMAMDHLQSIIAEQKQRTQAAQEQQRQASRQLEDARSELQGIRSEAFERFASGGEHAFTNADAPPAYQ